MKNKISILLIVISFGFIACESKVEIKNDNAEAEEQAEAIISKVDEIPIDKKQVDGTEVEINKEVENDQDKSVISSDLRLGETTSLNVFYTDTIEFLSYDDNYDYFLLLGKKNGKNVGLIYNWDWQNNEKYNFKNGELVKVKWKMDRIIHAGDEEIIDFGEWVIAAERILSGKENDELTNENTEKNNKLDGAIRYFEFNPDTIPNLSLSNFDLDYAYQLDAKKIVAGYDTKSNPDEEKDWGDKLLLLNNENEVLFQSYGVGDVYLFEPHYYKNVETDKIIIICQLGFEYFCGGQAFVYENGKITSIGLLDIESDSEEKSLIDMIVIDEKDNEIEFTFNANSLVLEPGSENILIKNTGVKYIYKNEELILVK